MEAFGGKRLVKRFESPVAGSAKEIFPLLCPVLEYDWIEIWACEMIYSESGVAENNCVFTTDLGGRGRAVWVCTRHEPEGLAVEYLVTYPETHVERLEARVEKNGPDACTVHWKRTLTGLTDEGNGLVELYANEMLPKIQEALARSLDHYARTGRMLKGADWL